ncbi:hypothetical protein GCM10023185_23060 [Hymenobacter saemangeumensis]|uniref:Porin n=1 Tax=Hymenobacter saemangeumensis TaxID=1084522 RepID=A0ABP8IFM6_9BACT
MLAAFLLLLASPRQARAQVLDDSTKVLYGPKTTRVIYEAEVLRDSTSGTMLDTTLTRWTQHRFWFHDTTFQQDLGQIGTASRPMLYQPNLQLGARFGRNVFDKYARDASSIPYYDSRSPYSFFRVVQSGEGEQVFEFSYSRSLRKNFSVGVAYERFASNKVLAANGRSGLVEHSNLLFFGRYQTENDRYRLLFNFSNVRHRAIEQGGIRPIINVTRLPTGEVMLSGETRPQDLFKYERQSINLLKAANTEDRDRLHFAQTYRLLSRGLTLFHIFDGHRQYNSYLDTELPRVNITGRPASLLFYPRTRLSFSATLDRAEYRQIENTLGVLGRTEAVEYRLYARRRDAELLTQTLKPGSAGNSLNLMEAAPRRSFGQVFLGGTAAFNYRKIYAIEAAGEYKLFDEYWARASVRTGPLSAEVLRTSYSPTLTQQEFVGNHYAWRNLDEDGNSSFRNTTADHLTLRVSQRLPLFSDHLVEASGSAVNLSRLVYYGPNAEPAQLEAGQDQQLLIITGRHRVRFGKVAFDNQATYTQGGDGRAIRIPRLVTFSRLYYQSYIFRKAMFSQIGAEVYYQSTFRAYNYSPSNQQFYVQDNFTIRNYPVVDLFLVADIKTVSIFLKWAYVNEGVFYDGYFTTPYYTGYPRRIILGVKWNFFN